MQLPEKLQKSSLWPSRRTLTRLVGAKKPLETCPRPTKEVFEEDENDVVVEFGQRKVGYSWSR